MIDSLEICKKFCVVLSAAAALAACGGSQSQSPSGPYSNDLLNALSQQPPLGGPVPGAAPSAPVSEPSPPVEPPPPSEPDVVDVDAAASAPVMDAGPEAGADAGRRRTGAARPAARRDGGR